jgi:putative addiction module component (TIGR02574 family)
MTVADVKAMSVEEKVQIMETIWEDMRDRFEHSDIPQSHKDLLDSRRARAASGDSKLLDWDAVKSSIGRS